MMPAHDNHWPMIELLMRYGARVPDMTKWCREYYFKHYDTAAFLMERGMSPNHMNCDRTTLLHGMAQLGDMRKAHAAARSRRRRSTRWTRSSARRRSGSRRAGDTWRWCGCCWIAARTRRWRGADGRRRARGRGGKGTRRSHATCRDLSSTGRTTRPCSRHARDGSCGVAAKARDGHPLRRSAHQQLAERRVQRLVTKADGREDGDESRDAGAERVAGVLCARGTRGLCRCCPSRRRWR